MTLAIDFVDINDDYRISNHGEVYSLKSGRYLQPQIMKNGYLKTSYKIGSSTLIHRLVAEAFIPNPNKFSEVNHKDGNKRNNRADNLEWVTPKGNMAHAVAQGLMSRKGENHKMVKLTEADVIAIRGSLLTGNALAEKYSVSIGLISMIINNKRWKHI
jgi:hypothetical protein